MLEALQMNGIDPHSQLVNRRHLLLPPHHLPLSHAVACHHIALSPLPEDKLVNNRMMKVQLNRKKRKNWMWSCLEGDIRCRRRTLADLLLLPPTPRHHRGAYRVHLRRRWSQERERKRRRSRDRHQINDCHRYHRLRRQRRESNLQGFQLRR